MVLVFWVVMVVKVVRVVSVVWVVRVVYVSGEGMEYIFFRYLHLIYNVIYSVTQISTFVTSLKLQFV